MRFRALPVVVTVVISCGVFAGCPQEPKPAAPNPRYTPRWAYEPWISKDISTGADTYAFVDGFKERDIPVGVVVLDSPWETNYNTFVPNPSRYPEFPKLVSDMRERNVRVVLWVTQMVNRTSFDGEPGGDSYPGASPNFAEGKFNNYFVNDAKLEFWWKGQGAAVDFFNDAGVAWWHAQQNDLFDAGISGWKLDFGDSYISTLPIKTAQGEKSLQEYSEAYYRDYLQYGISQRGREAFITMVRPYDKSYLFEGRFFARKEDAPVGWVGDNRRDWVGLEDALDHIFRSARAGYVMLGSDIGGYLDFDDVDMKTQIPFSQLNFVRWVAQGAMTPFMQLHGRGNFTPWTVPERADETVRVYRYWAKLHHQLVPFLFSTAQEAYAGRPVPIQPIGDEASWPHDYRYVLGNSFLVAPILDDTGIRDVALPAGETWIDWWTSEVHAGGTTLSAYDSTDHLKIPLFVREGALVPATVDDDSTGLGSAASAGRLTVLAWPSTTATAFTVHDEDGLTTTLTCVRDDSRSFVGFSRAPNGAVVRLFLGARTVSSVEGVAEKASRAELDAASSGWWKDGAYLWVRTEPGSTSVTVRH